MVSDVHLARGEGVAVAGAFERLVATTPGHEVVLLGDVFDLSREAPSAEPAEALASLLREHEPFRRALARHVRERGAVTLVAGNHDAALARPRVRDALLSTLGVCAGAPVAVVPWLLRRGAVHLEHGHVFDPDNAPAHPLVPTCLSTEPLGIAIMRRFVARHRAYAFAHAHETTPWQGVRWAFELFGPRAPLVVADWFRQTTRLCWEAGRQPWREERALGHAALERYAEVTGVAKEALEELARTQPTHLSFTSTFMRLYYDRILASVAGAVGGAAALGGSGLGLGLAVVGAAYVAHSVSRRGKSRYSGRVEERLATAAQAIRARTGADLVVLGHTHREEAAPGYRNTGSFAYARGTRPALVIGVDGMVERRAAPSS